MPPFASSIVHLPLYWKRWVSLPYSERVKIRTIGGFSCIAGWDRYGRLGIMLLLYINEWGETYKTG